MQKYTTYKAAQIRYQKANDKKARPLNFREIRIANNKAK